MEKIIVSLLFIGSAPKFLFLGDKMDSPMYRVEGFVAIYLALAFSFIPAIALFIDFGLDRHVLQSMLYFIDNHAIDLTLESIGD